MDSNTNNENKVKVSTNINRLSSILRKVSPKDNAAANYILEKSLRITSAVLVVTDILDSREVLGEELERTSISLVKDAAHATHSVSKRESLVSNLLALAGLLEAATLAGKLSSRSTTILVTEAVMLAEFIGKLGWQRGDALLSPASFAVDMPKDVFVPDAPQVVSRPPISHAKDTSSGYSTPAAAPYGQHAQTDITEEQSQVKRHYRERVQEVQKDRRATILGLLQRKDRISVRDVANVVRDCSEKTLQRELLALVKQGVLKKEGERRWSTYRLA